MQRQGPKGAVSCVPCFTDYEEAVTSRYYGLAGLSSLSSVLSSSKYIAFDFGPKLFYQKLLGHQLYLVTVFPCISPITSGRQKNERGFQESQKAPS